MSAHAWTMHARRFATALLLVLPAVWQATAQGSQCSNANYSNCSQGNGFNCDLSLLTDPQQTARSTNRTPVLIRQLSPGSSSSR